MQKNIFNQFIVMHFLSSLTSLQNKLACLSLSCFKTSIMYASTGVPHPGTMTFSMTTLSTTITSKLATLRNSESRLG